MISTKQIVEKLSGNKKFDVDEKLGLPEFIKFFETVTEGNLENENLFLSAFEESNQGNMIYKEDPENLLFKKIIQIIKEMKKTASKK